jgi:hypothetical protein
MSSSSEYFVKKMKEEPYEASIVIPDDDSYSTTYKKRTSMHGQMYAKNKCDIDVVEKKDVIIEVPMKNSAWRLSEFKELGGGKQKSKKNIKKQSKKKKANLKKSHRGL